MSNVSIQRRRKTPMERWCAKAALPTDPSGCWEWTGHKKKGYGGFWPGGSVNGVRYRYDVPAHRYGYERFIGPIPPGLTIDHLCRNPGCVNPEHLEAVTIGENVGRAPTQVSTINAAKTHCVHGHELSGNNLYVASNGARHCVSCRARRQKNRQRVPLGTAPSPVKTHCKRGHPLTGANVYVGRGSRVCRECHKIHQRNFLARKRGVPFLT